MTSSGASDMIRRAATLHQQGQLAAAQTLYEKALASEPRNADALNLLGVLFAQKGDPAKAVELMTRAVGLDPGNFFAFGNLAGAQRALRQLDHAVVSYDRALALKPDYADAYLFRGDVLMELGNPSAALESYGRYLTFNPGNPQAHCNLGNALLQLQRWESAVASYERALVIRPDLAEAHLNRGAALFQLGRLPEALGSFDQAIAISPRHAEAHMNRGNVLRRLDRHEDALASYATAIGINPRYAAAYLNRGIAFNDLNRGDDALASFDAAIAIEPGFAEAHFNKSLCLLGRGELATGWVEYEWRWLDRFSSNFRERRDFPQPRWSGQEPLVGRTILLYHEQGMGDTIQFCRYAPLVADRGGRVILEVPEPLTGIMASLDGDVEVVTRGSPLPDFDFQSPLMSLPLAFGTVLQTIPAPARYLRADAGKVSAWQARLAARGSPRVGLIWNGSDVMHRDRERSFPLAEWIPYLPADIQYFSLQKNVREADRVSLAANPFIWDSAPYLGDFSDTAALCECMDLVISVCTGVGHLSAALGRETWILLDSGADWRWLKERPDSPWYPTVRLFRQPARGDWRSVFEQVRSDLLRRNMS